MKKAIKYPETYVEYTIEKQRKCITSVVKNTWLTKIQILQKLNKID